MIHQSFRGLNRSIHDSSDNCKCLNNGIGYFIIENFLDSSFVKSLSTELIKENYLQVTQFQINQSSSEYGQVRSPFINQPNIKKYLESPIFVELTSEILVGNGIFHLFNGQVTSPIASHNQSKWHRDFNKCHISNPALGYNILLMLGEYSCLDDLSSLISHHEFEVINYSHLSEKLPAFKSQEVVRLRISPGSLLVFNSLLWHRVVPSNTYQLFINAMLTEPYIKQQIEFLGTDSEWLLQNYGTFESEIARLLGYWSKSPATLSEFRKKGQRTYRVNQG